MTALVANWFEDEDPRDLRRWAIAAIVVLGVHLAAISAYVYVGKPDEIGDDAAPIAVDFAPGSDVVDQARIDSTPTEEQPPVVLPQPPPPPPVPSPAVAIPEPVLTPPKVEEPQMAPQQARVKGGSPRIKEIWTSALAKHLARHITQYPRSAIARSEEGIVHLSFSVDHEGRVHDVAVSKGSGFPDLDDAAIKMVESAQPFPALPPTMNENQGLVDFPLRFENH